MFENVLYFLLGFLFSALIGLMLSPVFWNRAVRLTKQRIESAIPLSLNELQADKDQLRAEFAMSTRRLELSIEELQEKSALQASEIARKQDENAMLSEERDEKLSMLEALEQRETELRELLDKRENEVEEINIQLDERQAKLEESALTLEQLQAEMVEKDMDVQTTNVELVSKKLSLEDRDITLEEQRKRIQELEKENSKFKRENKTLTKKLDGKEKKISRLNQDKGGLEAAIGKSNQKLAQQRRLKSNSEEIENRLSQQVLREREKVDEAEVRIAKMALHMEALLHDASNANIKKVVDDLATEEKALKKQLKHISADRDQLSQQVEDHKAAFQLDWDKERSEASLLRERINDLAAQVVVMTSAVEGSKSPINAILERAERKGKEKTAMNGSEKIETLADRIRNLQQAARSAN